MQSWEGAGMLTWDRKFRTLPPRAHEEKGAVAVEFALVLPILVMLVFGIATAGLSYTHAIGVTNAVREGARFGATADASAGTWVDDVIQRVRATQFDDSPNEGSSTTAVCAQLIKMDSAGATTPVKSKCSTTGNTPALSTSSAPSVAAISPPPAGEELCLVRVWAARHFTISIIVVPAWQSTVLRSSVARYERETC